MDYEKKYNEAFERAKAGKPIDEVFPELKESEDKRIRNRIIGYLKQDIEEYPEREERINKMIAYLEKQKEQKPEDYDHEMWKNCEVNFEGGKKEVINNPEKYGLCKPAEWSEEDEKIYQSIMDDTIQENQLNDKQTNWLRDIKYRYFPQSQQEWSEEDEQYLLVCKNALNKYQRSDHWDANIISKWLEEKLKANRPPFKDREMKLKILKYLSTNCSVLEFEEVEDYLNNLQPHWKPSEEQMDWVGQAIIDSGNETMKVSLRSLYEDLKKL